MLDQEGKNKFVATLTQYKHKCDKLEDEIHVLKSAIYQLSLLPNGIYIGLDTQMHNLQTNIQENQDSTQIKKSVDILVDAMSSMQKQKSHRKINISEFITKGTSILGGIFIAAEDQKTFEYAKKLLQSEVDEQALLVQFTQLLEETVNWVHEQLNFCQQNHLAQLAINNQVNQIVEHLVIPESFAPKLNALKSNLAKPLTPESFSNVVENLTDLVKVSNNQDFLTRLPDRIAFEEHILDAFHRWERGFGEMSLAMADIDHFKEINNKFGPRVADKVLQKIAELFKSSLRNVDFIARYGGEEFVFIFEHTPAHEAWKVLDNLRIALEQTQFCHNKVQFNTTVSIGLSSMQHGDTIASLLTKTEDAMNQAKHGGRNRVILAGM